MFYVNTYLWSSPSVRVASFPVTSFPALGLTTLLNRTHAAQQAGVSLNVTSGKLSLLLRLGCRPLIDVLITGHFLFS